MLTQWPEDDGLEMLYTGKCSAQQTGSSLGSPAMISAMLAAMEVAETCKVLLQRETLLRQRLMNVDLLNMEFTQVDS